MSRAWVFARELRALLQWDWEISEGQKMEVLPGFEPGSQDSKS